ncbi:MAG: L,D-transpeptidase family protein [Verrucomicrobiales bacterium]
MHSLQKAKHLLVPLILAAFATGSPAQEINAHIGNAAAKAGNGIANWYQARGNNSVWDGERIGGLAEFIKSLDDHGLSPSLFQFDTWDAEWRSPSPDPSERAAVEVGTTQLALYAIQSLAYGFVDPTEVHPKWDEIPRKVSAYQFLEQALQQPPSQFASFLLESVPPHDRRYEDMVQTLAKYRRIESLGGWRSLLATPEPAGPGSKYPDLKLLRSRLQAEGDLPSGAGGKKRDSVIDERTGDAIKSFQFRHGIEPDGFLGTQTLQELNIPTRQRINTLIVNIDRLRWMPRSWEQVEHIEVNIAESALRLFNNRRQVTVMPVIVGVKGKHQTPVFHGKIQHLIFRPYWNVPHSIAKTELVPEALKNPAGYMAEHNYQLVESYGVSDSQALPVTVENLQRAASGSLLMRQSSGPNNSLGLVKFIFPNDSSVYLHDTPDHTLFERADRDFSHGCVRVARPDELATLLLQRDDRNWNVNAVRASMEDVGNPNRKEEFGTSMPVYLGYWTSTIMSDGRVRFDQDMYGHDRVMFQKFGLN